MSGLTRVDKSYGGLGVLEKFSWQCPERGVVVLFGPSGCGKTTLLRLLLGLEQPDAGELVSDAGQRVSVVFQEDRLLEWLGALENIRTVLPGEQASRGAEWLDRLGLSDYADYPPGRLSGGMKRRVALARAFAYDGDILYMDEPFQGLDWALKQKLIALTKDFADRRPVVVITHDLEEALALYDRLDLLDGPPLRIRRSIVRGEMGEKELLALVQGGAVEK